jgi:hypothetical protein
MILHSAAHLLQLTGSSNLWASLHNTLHFIVPPGCLLMSLARLQRINR